MNSVMITKTKTERKIYSRDAMISYFYCPNEIPNYLKEFPCILNENVKDPWTKKPLPKFEEISDNKQRPIYVTNKQRERQRTASNQSDVIDIEQNSKYRSQNMKPKNDKFNRYNLLNESQNNTVTNNDFVDNESDWQTVESKANKVSSNLSKQYVSNYQGQENHWKKWSKDRNLSGDKNNLTGQFSRGEKTNNFVVRKADSENRTDVTKLHVSRSFSTGTGQTEDIWQDDWDTEMQSQLAATTQESLDSYELPPSCLAATSAMEMHCPMTIAGHNNTVTDSSSSDFDQWFYIDLSNQVQGPFPSESMANWLATGYFDFSTKLRRQCDEQFLLLAEYRALYGRIPFTAGATINPILMSTTVDIDPVQLTAGLDRTTLHKVLTNATSLSSKISQYMATIPVLPDNDMGTVTDIDKLALIEDKRKLEESKAELERERKRIADEQEQWKIRIEREMEERMQSMFNQRMMEMNKKVADFTASVASLTKPGDQTNENISVNKDPIIESKNSGPLQETMEQPPMDISFSGDKSPKPLTLELSTDDTQMDNWHSMKDSKSQKKNKKTKNKSLKLSPDPTTIPIAVDVKKLETDKPPKNFKETGSIRFIQQETMDEIKQSVKITESPKPEVQLSWNIKPTVLNIEQSKVTKSLLEIQEEETVQEKAKNDLDKAIKLSKVEANKVTSFKESLLKSVAPARTPVIPSGKSIWDMATGDNAEIVVTTPIVEVEPIVQRPVPKIKKRSAQKPSDDYEKSLLSNNDGLLQWCVTKLSKFNRDMDVLTLVELLKEVPSENVPELTLELLDDSDFSKNFAKDFVKRREELSREEPQWQTVKKTSIVTEKGSNNGGQTATVTKGSGGGGSGKAKTKKKMVAIDLAKFKSS